MNGDAIEELIEAAARWRDADPDPVTRRQLTAMIGRADSAELVSHFAEPLGFGTAGIRGPLGPGPARMNRLVVRRSVAGIARHLIDTVPDAADRGVVVARDARHGSDVFARDAASVLDAHGIAVRLFQGPVPTPLAVFAVTHLGAAAGIVVTASHNPSADNGMKVIWSDGAQVGPPVDAGITAGIEAWQPSGGPVADTAPGQVEHIGAATTDPVAQAYLRRVSSLLTLPSPAPLRIAATALHGVGWELLEAALARADHHDLHPVRVQQHPDPDFPTVPRPNPEEPGALDLLLSLAQEVDADVALALDPDADRLAIAIPIPTTGEPSALGGDQQWRVLGGDETGALLLHHLLERTRGIPDRLVATTIVSSRLVSRMCAAAGVHFAETPTGFKWLCRPGLDHPERHQLLLYEEALGCAVGPDARDKDGISAAVVFLELLARLRDEGRTVFDVLDDLAVRHGAHVQSNGSIELRAEGAPATPAARIVDQLVDDPPGRLGGLDVATVQRAGATVARLLLEDDTRVMVRPSGTEPKLKYYCESIEPADTRSELGSARAAARRRLRAVVEDLGVRLR